MNMPAHRRARLRALIETRYKGNRKAFCAETEISEARLSQLLSTTYRKGGEFGEKVARVIEKKIALPDLYFDKSGPAGKPASNDELHGDPDTKQVSRDEFLRLMRIYMDSDARGRQLIMDTVDQVERDNLSGLAGSSAADNS